MQAAEHDEAVERAWLKRDWGALTKELRYDAHVFAFLDETGHTLRARVGTTQAPRGEPPVLRRISKHREVSSVVLLIAPTAAREAPLVARHYIGTIGGARLLDALAHFERAVDAPLLLVWDRLNRHRSAVTLAWLRTHDIANVFLPAYAPELNPEGQSNRHVKHAMLKAVPRDITALRDHTRREFRHYTRRPDTLAQFFDHPGLPITRPS